MKKIFLISLSLILTIAEARTVCKQFNTQAEAQSYFNQKKKGYLSLDGDKDGEACECLKGGSGYYRSVCKKWRIRNGKK